FEQLYQEATDRLLSVVNRRFLEAVCDILGISTRLSWSTDYTATGEKSERLVSICLAAGASDYVSGPRARSYLDESAFARAGVSVSYFDYSGYREYPQLFPPFEQTVTILDLIFNTRPHAPD